MVKVALIDDERDVLDMIAHMLFVFGLKDVTVVTHPSQLTRQLGSFDVVLTDMRFGRWGEYEPITGLDVTKAFLEQNVAGVTILLTGYDLEPEQVAEVDRYMRKPLDFAKFEKLVAWVLAEVPKRKARRDNRNPSPCV